MKRTLAAILAGSFFAGCSSLDNEALFSAIRVKDASQVQRILDSGRITLDPPQQPNQVNKPLAFAAAYGNLQIVKLLLAAGADIDGQVAYGDVSLIKAAEHGNREIIVYLLEQGADVNRPNAFGISPFIGLCGGDDIALVELALKHGGKVNESYRVQTDQNKERTNYTALQAAVVYGQAEVVKLLLANGGDPSIKAPNGKTCLAIAQEKNHSGIVDMLK